MFIILNYIHGIIVNLTSLFHGIQPENIELFVYVQSDFTTSVYTSQSEICDTKDVGEKAREEEPHYLTMASIMTIVDKRNQNTAGNLSSELLIFLHFVRQINSPFRRGCKNQH